MELIIDRWLHILAGITAGSACSALSASCRPWPCPRPRPTTPPNAITKHIAPLAWRWFRFAALVTWLTGAYYLERSGIGLVNAFLLQGSAAPIGIGAWLRHHHVPQRLGG